MACEEELGPKKTTKTTRQRMGTRPHGVCGTIGEIHNSQDLTI